MARSKRTTLSKLAFSNPSVSFDSTIIVKTDCFEWLGCLSEGSLSAVVTDPPYGVKEYDPDQLDKRQRGSGGVWRIPPSFDGNKRAPLPRFTALDHKARGRLRELFIEWSRLVVAALRPGGHLFIATNAYIAQLLFAALVEGGLEFRGEIIRLVRTLRGGDRPKNAEQEFSATSSLPRGCYEPWGLFRKPLGGMTVSDCLREHGTGALRRYVGEKPFEDVISSERTPRRERQLADHPSLKPQSFLRRLVYVALPLGSGLIADPFMGSGSTIAAAEAIGYDAIGVERNDDYFSLASQAIPALARVSVPETDELVGVDLG